VGKFRTNPLKNEIISLKICGTSPIHGVRSENIAVRVRIRNFCKQNLPGSARSPSTTLLTTRFVGGRLLPRLAKKKLLARGVNCWLTPRSPHPHHPPLSPLIPFRIPSCSRGGGGLGKKRSSLTPSEKGWRLGPSHLLGWPTSPLPPPASQRGGRVPSAVTNAQWQDPALQNQNQNTVGRRFGNGGRTMHRHPKLLAGDLDRRRDTIAQPHSDAAEKNLV